MTNTAVQGRSYFGRDEGGGSRGTLRPLTCQYDFA